MPSGSKSRPSSGGPTLASWIRQCLNWDEIGRLWSPTILGRYRHLVDTHGKVPVKLYRYCGRFPEAHERKGMYLLICGLEPAVDGTSGALGARV